MVVIAIGLALVGVVLARRQTASLGVRLMAEAEARARYVAVTARNQITQRIESVFGQVLDGRRPIPAGQEGAKDWPAWLDGLYIWNGQTLATLRAPAEDTAAIESSLRARLADQPCDALLREPSGTSAIFYEFVGYDPIAISCVGSTSESGAPQVLAGHIHRERLRDLLVEPLLGSDDALQLVPADQAGGPWSVPLFGALQNWAIQPSAAFQRERRGIAVLHDLAGIVLPILSLIIVLGAMWLHAKAAEREMALAELKANFVADVSHELKTPLAMIHMFAETLQSGRVTSEEKRQEYYAIILRESTRLTQLINNILDFARIEAGRHQFDLQPTDIAEVVRETYEAYLPELERNGFEHHLSIEEDLPPINADRNALVQVLINLFTNAIKYSKDEFYLAVELEADTRRNHRGVVLSVHDRGIGVRPEERARLFDGFYRSADTQVRQTRGTGLGLALVKNIVEAHQGTLDVESRLVKGSSFRIFLPASDQAAAPEHTDAMEASAPAGRAGRSN